MAPAGCWYVRMPRILFILILMYQEPLVLAHRSEEQPGGNHSVYWEDVISSPIFYTPVALFMVIIAILATVGWVGCCYLWFKRDREMRSLARDLRAERVHYSNRRPSPVMSGSSNPSCTFSTTQHRLSPRPILTHRQLQIMDSTTLSLGVPFSASDLSAMAASGRQTVSRTSRSNPELTIQQCYNKNEHVSTPANPPWSILSQLPSNRSEVQFQFGENGISPTSHESFLCYSEACTSNSLPSSPTHLVT